MTDDGFDDTTSGAGEAIAPANLGPTPEPAPPEDATPPEAAGPSEDASSATEPPEVEGASKRKSKAEPEQPKEPEPKYGIGTWSGLPNFGCPYCAYSTLQGDGDIELHILSRLDLGDAAHLPALTIVRPEEA